jgi:hypothetical protein
MITHKKRNLHIIFIIFISIVSFKTQAQNWQWISSFGGPIPDINNNSPDEEVTEMKADRYGNIYTCGRILPGAQFNGIAVPAYNNYDSYLAKYDCMGNLLWVKTAGSEFTDESKSMALDSSGNIYICGRVGGDAVGHPLQFYGSLIAESMNDLFIAKFDSSGNLIWKVLGGRDVNILGSDGMKLRIDPQGNLNMLMYTTLDGPVFAGHYLTRGTYIAKFDLQGNLLDVNEIYNDANVFMFKGFEISPNGDIYLTGILSADTVTIGGLSMYRISQSVVTDLFLIKLNSSRVGQWFIQRGSQDFDWLSGNGIEIDHAGDIYWTATVTNGIVMGTDTFYNSLNLAPTCVFPAIVKFDSSGNVIWTNHIEQFYQAEIDALKVKSNGNVVVSGWFNGDVHVGMNTLTSVGTHDMFMAELDASGVFISADVINGTGDREQIKCMDVDMNDNVYAGGGFNGSLNFNNQTYTYLGGITDGFLLKTGAACTTGIAQEINEKNSINIFPNPANDEICVSLNKEIFYEDGILELRDAMGRICLTAEITHNNKYIKIEKLEPGFYTWRMQIKGAKVRSGTLVIER